MVNVNKKLNKEVNVNKKLNNEVIEHFNLKYLFIYMYMIKILITCILVIQCIIDKSEAEYSEYIQFIMFCGWIHKFHETCHSVTFYFMKERLQTMLWHHNTRVNSHQRWKQTRNRVCFHLWCELTLALWCHSIVWSLSFMK